MKVLQEVQEIIRKSQYASVVRDSDFVNFSAKEARSAFADRRRDPFNWWAFANFRRLCPGRQFLARAGSFLHPMNGEVAIAKERVDDHANGEVRP
jgi:hypothetical protein